MTHPVCSALRLLPLSLPLLGVVACGAGAPGQVEVGPELPVTKRFNQTFASGADFAAPHTSLSGVSVTPSGYVQVNADVSIFETPYIWVANASARTVSQVDTKTLMVKGTFG